MHNIGSHMQAPLLAAGTLLKQQEMQAMPSHAIQCKATIVSARALNPNGHSPAAQAMTSSTLMGTWPRCRAALYPRRPPKRASPQAKAKATARLINGSLPKAEEPNKPVRRTGLLPVHVHPENRFSGRVTKIEEFRARRQKSTARAETAADTDRSNMAQHTSQAQESTRVSAVSRQSARKNTNRHRHRTPSQSLSNRIIILVSGPVFLL